ncbi:hypothetical protein J2Y45_002109 [Dyadobacter sp. BE34]|uniref:Transmembrane protein n=1 Tax=Dyadobacter fermentans TaxID=94254 RepID=A0ABU1QWN3_9BACT|nr:MULTISPECIES: hypothetical protein [Dyadobacter]MDR6805582.1 hypothetical protein [Dyadobacter fermentans]MDR7042658.1 hypothetical protein [Dyadobacter sp. BE242]MDR7196970.1 hypothetical protein [Dyadobacter sp. BE34]MDR7215595.1 hypothetical protein [Dyadobacter sp. BE31]MDR7263131.1 hypothetical protein [Dyadobacter sp. BE32]
MKFQEQLNIIGSLFASVWLIIKSMVTSPALLILSSSTVGIIQVFSYRSDLTGMLAAAVGAGFFVMTVCGLAKHVKDGEAKADIFLQKTVVQFIVMFSVIFLGYAASLVITVIFKVVTEAVPGAMEVPGVALYFMFAGYAIMFTYYFIKSCDLVDQIMPGLLPKAFSAPFRKYRKTGDFKDLLSFQDEEKEVTP